MNKLLDWRSAIYRRKKGIAVVIQNEEGKVLLCKRGSSARSEKGFWENPGGEIEDGEGYIEAAKREIMEELGVEVEIIDFFYINEFEPDENLIIWEAGLLKGEINENPQIIESEKCSAIGWFSINQLESLPLASFTRLDFTKLGWLAD